MIKKYFIKFNIIYLHYIKNKITKKNFVFNFNINLFYYQLIQSF